MLTVSCALGLAVSATSQTDDQWTQIDLALHSAERKDWALEQLDPFGAAAVRRLVDLRHFPRRAERIENALFAVRELAHHADAEVYAKLVELEQKLPAAAVPDLLLTELTALPFLADADATGHHARIGKLGYALMDKHDAEARHECWLAWRLAEQLGPQLRRDQRGPYVAPAIGIERTTAELIAEIGPRQDPDRCHAAARLLGRRGREARDAVPKLLAVLRRDIPRFFSPSRVQPKVDNIVHRPIAVALTRVAPGSTAAAEAHGYLLLHGTTTERARAFRALRHHVAVAAPAVPFLQESLRHWNRGIRRNRSAERRESLITLGILGRHAAPARAILKTYAGHHDRSLATAAHAALRSIDADLQQAMRPRGETPDSQVSRGSR